MTCIFCSIAEGKIPSKVIWQDEHVLAFHDLTPVAPTHALVIPKTHIVSLADATDSDRDLLARVMLGVQRTAKELELVKDGFRTVINSGKNGGQSVFHLHVHLLGGRALTWPPG